MDRRWGRLCCVIAIGVGAGVSAAPAAADCGPGNFAGVVYHVSSAHLQLQLTGHFQDTAGDYQDTTFTLNDVVSHPLALTQSRFALFNSCSPPIYGSNAAIPGVYSVNASWYSAGDPPSTGSCQGTYRAPTAVESAWHHSLAGVLNASGNPITPRSPELDVTSVLPSLTFGSCNASDTGIIRDAADRLATGFAIPLRLPVASLRRGGARLVLSFNVTREGSVPDGGANSFNPGAASTIKLHWQGTVTYARSYTCHPHGCVLPSYLPQ